MHRHKTFYYLPIVMCCNIIDLVYSSITFEAAAPQPVLSSFSLLWSISESNRCYVTYSHCSDTELMTRMHFLLEPFYTGISEKC